MHNEIAEYLSKYVSRIDELYRWPFKEDIPRREFGFNFSGKTAFQKPLELKRQISEAAKDAPSEEEKERLATYFIKDWGGIAKISDAREIVSRFNPVAFSEALCRSDFGFKKISSWSKWLSVVCPKWACIYDTRVTYSLNAINYISGAKHKIFPMPDGRNTQVNILDVTTLLLSRKLSVADSSKPKAIGKSHFVSESAAYETYTEVIHKYIFYSGIARRLVNSRRCYCFLSRIRTFIRIYLVLFQGQEINSKPLTTACSGLPVAPAEAGRCV